MASNAAELFFDAVDISAVKAEQEQQQEQQQQLPGERRETMREGAGGGDVVPEGIDGAGQRRASLRPHPPSTPPPTPAAAAAPAPAPPAASTPPPPPPITASELRLAASAALRLAVEALDALESLKEAVLEVAADVRELLEATRRASGGIGRRRNNGTTAATTARRLGVRTRSQARRRR